MTNDVIIEKEGAVGRIRLNRPSAIHALTHDMCSAMIAALVAWRDDDTVQAVTIDHAEGRGFCSGGDVVMLATSGADDGKAAAAFFHEEYRLNHLLFTYEKPIVAFMDGITMGGGVGISMPAKYRVATENTRFAMPETAIGLFPDVGGGWYLSRLPGRMGQFLALTGARLDGAECRYLGLATHYIAQEKLAEVKARIAEHPDRLEGILGNAGTTAPDARIAENQLQINRTFAGATLEEIIAALEADDSPWALKELATLRSKAPLSCKLSLRLLEQGAAQTDFADEMKVEYRLASRVVRIPDFAEGVRAVLIDKDNAPNWQPPTPEEVTEEMVDAIFAPDPDGGEWTPQPR